MRCGEESVHFAIYCRFISVCALARPLWRSASGARDALLLVTNLISPPCLSLTFSVSFMLHWLKIVDWTHPSVLDNFSHSSLILTSKLPACFNHLHSNCFASLFLQNFNILAAVCLSYIADECFLRSLRGTSVRHGRTWLPAVSKRRRAGLL